MFATDKSCRNGNVPAASALVGTATSSTRLVRTLSKKSTNLTRGQRYRLKICPVGAKDPLANRLEDICVVIRRHQSFCPGEQPSTTDSKNLQGGTLTVSRREPVSDGDHCGPNLISFLHASKDASRGVE
jgi:hypothetical protein